MPKVSISDSRRVRALGHGDSPDPRDHRPRLHGGRRPSPRRVDEHQAADGSRLLSRASSSSGLPVRGQRTHTNARTRKGPAKPIAGKKKVRGATSHAARRARPRSEGMGRSTQRAPQARTQEHHVGHRPCRVDVQQHDDHHHRRAGQHDRLVVCRAMGFKGSRKSTPYAAQVAAEDAAKKAPEHGMRTLEVEVAGPGSGASRRCARCRRPASPSRRSGTSRPIRTTAAGRRSAGACKRHVIQPTVATFVERIGRSFGCVRETMR